MPLLEGSLQSLSLWQLQQNQNYSDDDEGPGSGRGTPVRDRPTKTISKVRFIILHMYCYIVRVSYEKIYCFSSALLQSLNYLKVLYTSIAGNF